MKPEWNSKTDIQSNITDACL